MLDNKAETTVWNECNFILKSSKKYRVLNCWKLWHKCEQVKRTQCHVICSTLQSIPERMVLFMMGFNIF